jgi:hypothetical protein
MPNYPGAPGATSPAASNLSPIALQRGESQYVFGVLAASATQLPVNDTNVADEAAAGQNAVQASIACNLQAGSEGEPVPMVTVEVSFPAAPGAGESIAIQESDTDADAFYITPSNTAYTIATFTNNSGRYVARADLSPTGGRYMRLVRTKGANAVAIRAKISRIA